MWTILFLMVTAGGMPLQVATPPNPEDTCDVEICYGIRPGALVRTPGSSDCTAGFILVSKVSTFVTIPAHCVKSVGQEMWFYHRNVSTSADSFDDRPADADVVFIHPEYGETDSDKTQPFDIALAAIRPGAVVDVIADVCHWGGPEALLESPTDPAAIAYIYGHGFLFHETSEARQGTRMTLTNDGMFFVTAGTAVGDSGAPWLGPGLEAIGFHTRRAVGAEYVDGTNKGIQLQHALSEYASHGFPLRLLLAGEHPPSAYAHDEASVEPPASKEVPGFEGLLTILAGVAAGLMIAGCGRRLK